MGSRRGRRDTQARRRAGLGAIAGVLAGAAALGAGQLVAGLTGASGSPVVEVGELQIDHTPPWLKNFAITEFGANDKLALVTGIIVVLAIFAALIGVLAVRRWAYGMAGLAVFAVIGITAAATRPTATVASLLPTLAATAAAALVLRVLVDRVGPARSGAADAYGGRGAGVDGAGRAGRPGGGWRAGRPGPAGRGAGRAGRHRRGNQAVGGVWSWLAGGYPLAHTAAGAARFPGRRLGDGWGRGHGRTGRAPAG